MKIGDYVRTDTGIIQKIGKIYEQNETNDTHIQLNRMGTGKSVFILDNDKELSYSKGEVIKSSPNIIDLIEVGDYVNGHRVIDINNVAGFVIVNTSSISENTIFSYNIKSIVTKEMYSSVEYRMEIN